MMILPVVSLHITSKKIWYFAKISYENVRFRTPQSINYVVSVGRWGGREIGSPKKLFIIYRPYLMIKDNKGGEGIKN